MRKFGQKLHDSFVGVGMWAFMLARTSWISVKQPPSWHLLLEQLFQIGILSIPVVAVTGFSTGLVLAAQSFYQLGDKGLTGVTGLFVAKGMLTEVGPVLTAFMVTGRVGSSMTAILGTMRVTEQIDALKSMAVNPYRYLIAPRILGGVIMMPILTVFSAAMGILGGYLISIYFFNMTPQGFWDPLPGNITIFDMWIGFIKALFFGLLISTIACYKGMTTRGGAIGVGRSITNSVVITYSYILIVNFLLTVGLNVIYNAALQKYEM